MTNMDAVQVGDRIRGWDGFGFNDGTVVEIVNDRFGKSLRLAMDEPMEDGSVWEDTVSSLTTVGIGWYWLGRA